MDSENRVIDDRRAPDLSLVIPAYNESAKIERDLKAFTSYLDRTPLSYEIVVVDDGSLDTTSEIVSAFAENCPYVLLLRNRRNRGKGYSIKRGVLTSRGKYIGFVDAGLCIPPAEIESALSLLNNGCDVALGSRVIPGSNIVKAQPWYRLLGSRVFSFIVWHIMGLSIIKDTQCGFKFYSRKAARELFGTLRTTGFMFDVELLRKALRRKLKMSQFPVTWTNDPDTRYKLVSGSLRNMVELLRIKLLRD